jgi:hypothetical protein
MAFELTGNEELWLTLYRPFDFVRRKGYFSTAFAIYGPEPWFTLENYRVRRSVSVGFSGFLDVRIKGIVKPKSGFPGLRFRKRDEFALHQVYERFGSEILGKHPRDVEKIIKFMQQHLMPVLDGSMWLDELLENQATDPSGPQTS